MWRKLKIFRCSNVPRKPTHFSWDSAVKVEIFVHCFQSLLFVSYSLIVFYLRVQEFKNKPNTKKINLGKLLTQPTRNYSTAAWWWQSWPTGMVLLIIFLLNEQQLSMIFGYCLFKTHEGQLFMRRTINMKIFRARWLQEFGCNLGCLGLRKIATWDCNWGL